MVHTYLRAIESGGSAAAETLQQRAGSVACTICPLFRPPGCAAGRALKARGCRIAGHRVIPESLFPTPGSCGRRHLPSSAPLSRAALPRVHGLGLRRVGWSGPRLGIALHTRSD